MLFYYLVANSTLQKPPKLENNNMSKDKDESIIAGILRVEATNDRTGMVKIHKSSLGPYSSSNPKVCLDCGKPLEGVQGDEPCPMKK